MADRHSSYPPLADYAIIGDCRSAALISRNGSVDWLCLPRFDGPSLFGALLDRRRGGSFAVHPAASFTTRRRYLERTNVLETTLATDGGTARLVDLMPVASEEEKRRQLAPEHEVLRMLEGVDGEVDLQIQCDPRPHYGALIPALDDRGPLGYCFQYGAEALVLRSDIPLERAPSQPGLRGRVRLRRGERRFISLAYAHREPAVLPLLGEAAEHRLAQTIQWWHGWASRCRYDGVHRDAVVRSMLTLKLMSYAPSGAVIAAPTTSLPERIGGVRNWDYRYCWLRDASLTMRALMDLGYDDEARAFLAWMLHSTRLTWPELNILYDVHGDTHLPERELDHLEGYAESRPVRVGNGAADQLQLDVYGEVADAVFEFVRRGGRLDRTTARLLVGLGHTVCRRWREPDEGIWEVRGGRRHHTYSKAMCWVALDRLIRLSEAGHLKAPISTFAPQRDAIRAAIEARGYNRTLRSYVSVFDGDDLDASLLLLARYRYAEPTAPRMIETCERVHERLGVNGLLYRYLVEDGLPPGEGAFGIASFWGITCRCLQSDLDGAASALARLCSLANDVGLFGEEIDPATGAQLGNFPQAFTHVGLIDAALALGIAKQQRREQPARVRSSDPGAAG
ncbi:MAG: glycoside hydrolase family 15 protein [Candidatus Rokubacteria bacterium]|nr:glycoside hydrolase family 15 protein [Candidatus Rokubacteria bacterium]MBI3108569.1 glycoside hydrolase family 15 protein [Candidatus Rokubacteria bacterium]